MKKVIIYFVAGYFLFLAAKYWLADYFYAKGDISSLERAVSLSPNEASYRVGLSEEYAKISPEMAKDQLIVTIDLSPRNIKLLKTVAAVYDDIEEKETSLEIYKEITLLAPTDAQAWYNMALEQAKLGQIDEARETLVKVLDMKPDYSKARELFAILQ